MIPPLRPWLLETVLPFWATVGRDHAHGGFVERLDRDRTPRADDKRIRVQARQIYAMSHGHILGAGPFALEAARAGWDFLRRHGWDDGWRHLVDPAGRPVDPTQDLYDHAFILLAMAWLHRAAGDAEPLDWARRTSDLIDRRFAAPGGYRETAGEGPLPLPRRQNPHMHLFEALLALHEATGDRDWLDRARGMVELFLGHFFDRETGSLGEFFTADWQPAPGAEGRLREPGHHFEWVWLLLHYRRLSGDQRVTAPADALYRFGSAFGIDRGPGQVVAAFDGVDRDGTVVHPTKRLWVQTELLKAYLARVEFFDDVEARRLAEDHLEMMFRDYLGAGHPVWRDRLTRDGREVDDFIPASTLYHVFLAMTEAIRVLGR